MNNVLNRKMFVNRNARAKLANMGGILASSPEMVDATQRFAPGGTVLRMRLVQQERLV